MRKKAKLHLLKNYWTFLFLITFLFFGCISESKKTAQEEINVLKYVDPFIGTAFHGHTFPGPVRPHGMMQLSPDTKLNGWDASSGYHYDDNTIYGFSHTHLSGTGIGDMGDVLLLPFTDKITKKKPIATFNKADEFAKAGYYSVRFNNYKVKAELAVTKRVGIHKYTFAKDAEKRVLFDLSHTLQRTWGNSNIYNELEVINSTTIRGLKHTKGWASDHKVYFYAKFSSPFSLEQTNIDSVIVSDIKIAKGKNVFAYLKFDELKDEQTLQVKVSISPVDTKGAENNMISEMPSWNFDQVQKESEDVWEKALQSIKVTTNNQDDLTVFYTALYHSMIAPMIYQDTDGRYRGMDKKIHQAKVGANNYTVYSLWDTFRALHPLMTIIDESKSVEWANNLILKYQEGGMLPMWPLASNYTATMVGYPAVANIADILAKDIPGVDKKMALKATLNSALYDPSFAANAKDPKEKALMPLYNKYVNDNKHIPADKMIKSVSFGLEMAYYDWCIAEIAKLNQNDSLVEVFQKRAKNYQHYFNDETGFMRGKNEDNSWVTPFNAKYSSHDKAAYTEGNAWQWTWFVPHDVDGLIKLYKGKENFTQKLDSLFTTSSEILGEHSSADITGLIGQYAHGNEPSHHVAYLYTMAGKPWKTQEVVDQILREFYSSNPDGIIGNEDCGQMSAWYVLNAMGFYQVTPGKPIYTIGRPLFDKVEIPLASNKVFTIITENNSKENKYVQAFYLNNVKQDHLSFLHSDIKKGSTLKIVMGSLPKK
jgi:predicted alpha-1,2-mannosidase